MTEFDTITPNNTPDYRERIADLSEEIWPEFMLNDSVADVHWGGLFEKFAAYQFALVDRQSGAIAGFANSAPLRWESAVEDLPDAGWDWALIQSAADYENGVTPNVLCGLQISVSPSLQGKGISRILLHAMVDLARTNGFPIVIIPVRPSLKSRYPLTSMDRYITWTTEQGLPFDPWLRVHVRNGGRIVKPCPLAMEVVGTVAEWEVWTGMRFFESGDYIVPGALSPVRMDVEADRGVYIEPNVWVVHVVG